MPDLYFTRAFHGKAAGDKFNGVERDRRALSALGIIGAKPGKAKQADDAEGDDAAADGDRGKRTYQRRDMRAEG